MILEKEMYKYFYSMTKAFGKNLSPMQMNDLIKLGIHNTDDKTNCRLPKQNPTRTSSMQSIIWSNKKLT